MEAHFLDFTVEDGHIERIEIRRDGVLVRFKDWKERLFEIHFNGAIAVEDWNIIGDDIGSFREESDSTFLTAACQRAGEPTKGFRCFLFVSAWSETCALRIVAESASTSGPVDTNGSTET